MTKYPNTEKLLNLFNANRRALDFSNEDDAAIVRDILLALKNATPELMALVLVRQHGDTQVSIDLAGWKVPDPATFTASEVPATDYESTGKYIAARKSATKRKSK